MSVKSVLVKPGKLARVIGKGSSLGHTLAANPDPVFVVLELGAQAYCGRFGGSTQFQGRDQGSRQDRGGAGQVRLTVGRLPRLGEPFTGEQRGHPLAPRLRDAGHRSWELRARQWLVRLELERGNRAAAQATIRPIVDFQTEGADRPDLRAARALLDATS